MKININGVWREESGVPQTATSNFIVENVPVVYTQTGQFSSILYIPESFAAKYPGRKVIIFWHSSDSVSIVGVSSVILNSTNISSNVKGVSISLPNTVIFNINTQSNQYGIIV